MLSVMCKFGKRERMFPAEWDDDDEEEETSFLFPSESAGSRLE